MTALPKQYSDIALIKRIALLSKPFWGHIFIIFLLGLLAARDLALEATLILGGITAFLAVRMLRKCAFSKAAIMQAIDALKGPGVKSVE